jgi:hypothetical protein
MNKYIIIISVILILLIVFLIYKNKKIIKEHFKSPNNNFIILKIKELLFLTQKSKTLK